MQRMITAIKRIRHHGVTPGGYRKVCVAAFVMLCFIVVTGAAVRLTNSGLGCVDWPECNAEKFVDVSSKHAAIEQINRLITGLVAAAVIAAVLGSLLRRPRRRDLTLLSLGLVAGVIGQVVLGAFVVWVDLHPAAVQGHFVLSMVLCANAVVLIHRAGLADEGRRVATVLPRTRRRLNALVVWTGLALLAGTVVTGTGPHAGDEKARRFEFFSISWATRIHGAVVWIAVAMALLLVWHLRAKRSDRAVLDGALVLWFCLAVAQGTLGYVQYAAGVPAGLVALHVALATLLWSATVWMRCLATGVGHSAGDLVDDALHRARGERKRDADRADDIRADVPSSADASPAVDDQATAEDAVDAIIARARRRRSPR